MIVENMGWTWLSMATHNVLDLMGAAVLLFSVTCWKLYRNVGSYNTNAQWYLSHMTLCDLDFWVDDWLLHVGVTRLTQVYALLFIKTAPKHLWASYVTLTLDAAVWLLHIVQGTTIISKPVHACRKLHSRHFICTAVQQSGTHTCLESDIWPYNYIFSCCITLKWYDQEFC